jgi:acetaldehyde dehydrogenase (acetylating)
MPVSRVIVNSPSTHGAIGFTTDLEPSMTLGCGSWGGNVTSDNISPRHLMDVKRIAFETKPINQAATTEHRAARAAAPVTVDRAAIAALVDRFLADRHVHPHPHSTELPQTSSPLPPPPVAAPPPAPERTGNGGWAASRQAGLPESPTPQAAPPAAPVAASNGASKPRVYDFVCEEDVRRAIAAREKIYINGRTIITPAARDLGEEREVFARG